MFRRNYTTCIIMYEKYEYIIYKYECTTGKKRKTNLLYCPIYFLKICKPKFHVGKSFVVNKKTWLLI